MMQSIHPSQWPICRVLSAALANVLSGQMLCPNIYVRIAYNGFAINVFPHWRHYHEVHGLPITAWENTALDDIPF